MTDERQMRMDLNRLPIEVHGWTEAGQQVRFRGVRAATSANGAIRVYFEDLEKHLLGLIEKADAVLGCVAWLTSEPILAALAKKSVVAIVVQKEDFLRPDIDARGDWRAHLHSLYASLRCDIDRYPFENVVGALSTCGDSNLAPVRCAGIYNRQRAAACPRMHHKFLVMADLRNGWRGVQVKPHTVWTGSFNLTRNAVLSLENAVVITDPAIVMAYYEEWGHVEALSEPLDWEVEWASPEWRIGS